MMRATTTLNLLAAGLLALTPAASAQQDRPDLSGFWMVSFNQQPGPEGRALMEKLPQRTVFIDDTGGGELGLGEYDGLSLSEDARRQVEAHDFDEEFELENTCIRPSVAYYMQAPFPIEIHQGRDMIVMQIEYFDMYRIIFMDGREHPPEDAPHSKSGHSIGHWEGDELVVDTTHVASGTFMNNGFNHSDDIHITERFKLSEDGDTLMAVQSYEDPEVFEGTAARYMTWRREDGHVYPYECDPTGFGR